MNVSTHDRPVRRGVVRHPFETAGIDFYSGFRKNGQGGVQIEILKIQV